MLQLVSYSTLPNLSPLPKRKCRKHLNANMLQVSGISASSIAALCETRVPRTLSHCALKFAVFLVGRTAIFRQSFSKQFANCIGACREITSARTLSGCHFVCLLVKELLHLTSPLANRIWAQVSRNLEHTTRCMQQKCVLRATKNSRRSNYIIQAQVKIGNCCHQHIGPHIENAQFCSNMGPNR